ncbi:hypothetical protein B0H11DRAFT_2376921 [Mycena galericulata]|nr:hypothetical protein B0H11DRAFT_2376921 [Mycena galericulata]
MQSGPQDAAQRAKNPRKIGGQHHVGSRYLATVAWAQMLDTLTLVGRVDHLNHMFPVLTDCAVKDRLRVHDADRSSYLNAQRLLDDAKATETAAFLVTYVMGPRMDVPRLVRPLWEYFIRRGCCIEIVKNVSGAVRAVAEHPITALSTLVYERHAKVPYGIARPLARLSQEHGVPMVPAHAVRLLQAYEEVPGTNELPKDMDERDWAFLLVAAVGQEIMPSHRSAGWLSRACFVKHGTDELHALFGRLGFEGVLRLEGSAIEVLADAAAASEGEALYGATSGKQHACKFRAGESEHEDTQWRMSGLPWPQVGVGIRTCDLESANLNWTQRGVELFSKKRYINLPLPAFAVRTRIRGAFLPRAEPNSAAAQAVHGANSHRRFDGKMQVLFRKSFWVRISRRERSRVVVTQKKLDSYQDFGQLDCGGSRALTKTARKKGKEKAALTRESQHWQPLPINSD